MNIKKICIILFGFLAFVALSGCASVMIPEMRQAGVTIQDLESNWSEYSVYYSGASTAFPTAIMFDPNNDSNKLVGVRWTRVEDQETLSALVSRIRHSAQNIPRIWSIMGPDNQLFGYIFTSSSQVFTKAVDHHTFEVYEVPPPREPNH